MASANHEGMNSNSSPSRSRERAADLEACRRSAKGDEILVGRKATGTLITDNLIPGQAPAAAVDRHRSGAVRDLIKDPDVL